MKMQGSDAAIRYALRDLDAIKRALTLFEGRDICVQAGACLGVFPQYLSQVFKTVYTFEPDPKLFREAQHNAVANNIVWLNAAVGYRRMQVGTSKSRRDGSKTPTHEGLTHVVEGMGPIPILRIDDLDLHYCDLICLDIEGYEYHALAGARATIDRCKPVLIVEVNKQIRHAGITEDDLRKQITDRGYELRFRSHSDEVFTPCKK